MIKLWIVDCFYVKCANRDISAPQKLGKLTTFGHCYIQKCLHCNGQNLAPEPTVSIMKCKFYFEDLKIFPGVEYSTCG